LFIAEERDDGVNTPGYICTSTEPYTTDISKVTLSVASTVVVLGCLLTGGVIIHKSKDIC